MIKGDKPKKLYLPDIYKVLNQNKDTDCIKKSSNIFV